MKSRKIGLSFLLSASLLLQALANPALLWAATNTPSVTQTDVSNPAPQQNPPLEIINEKLETIAREKGIPSILLKAIAYQESAWRQFDSQGNPLLSKTSSHPAIGIMQIATYDDNDLETIQKLKTDIDFNIRRGADLLNEKWSMVPKIGDGDRNKLENWYFAIWAYNSWSGKNNPNQALNSSGTNSTSTSNSNSASGLVPPSTSGVTITGPTAPTTSTGPTTPTSSATPQTSSPVLPVYQDRLLDLIAKPEAWLSRYIQPVNITRIPANLLPKEGVPQATVQWMTPQPVHLGDLNTGKAVVTEWVRVQGTDRIETAIQQAKLGWPQGASSVILARADDFPDALAGIPFAARLQAPVLLTAPQELDSRVLATLKTLRPQTIYLLGGEGAMSSKIIESLQKNGWNSGNVIRIYGENRYATASSLALASAVSSLSKVTTQGHISAETIAQGLSQGASLNTISTVAITTGENFPDALSIASIAGMKKMPILLTSKQNLPPETLEALQRLHPSKVYLIGGEGVIAASVEEEIQKTLKISNSQIKSLFGKDRYETMAAVAQEFSGDIQNLCFATGEDFSDALAGAAFATHQNSMVVLLPKGSLNDYSSLKSWLTEKIASITQSQTSNQLQTSSQTQAQNQIQSQTQTKTISFHLFGGPGAISLELEKELKTLSAVH